MKAASMATPEQVPNTTSKNHKLHWQSHPDPDPSPCLAPVGQTPKPRGPKETAPTDVPLSIVPRPKKPTRHAPRAGVKGPWACVSWGGELCPSDGRRRGATRLGRPRVAARVRLVLWAGRIGRKHLGFPVQGWEFPGKGGGTWVAWGTGSEEVLLNLNYARRYGVV